MSLHLTQTHALAFTRRDRRPDGDEHFHVNLGFIAVADGLGMSRYDERVGIADIDVPPCSLDHAVNAASGRPVDERIDPVPESVARVKHIRILEKFREITIRVRISVKPETYPVPVDIQLMCVCHDDRRIEEGGKSKFQSSTRCAVLKCLSVIS